MNVCVRARVPRVYVCACVRAGAFVSVRVRACLCAQALGRMCVFQIYIYAAYNMDAVVFRCKVRKRSEG